MPRLVVGEAFRPDAVSRDRIGESIAPKRGQAAEAASYDSAASSRTPICLSLTLARSCSRRKGIHARCLSLEWEKSIAPKRGQAAEAASYDRGTRTQRAEFLHRFPIASIVRTDAMPNHCRMDKPSFPAHGKANLRRGRSSETGRIYLITFCTADRADLFSDRECARAFILSLNSGSVLKQSNLLCWVLMPDHWHGLVELGPADTLSTLTGRIKGATARAINSSRKTRGCVWSDGFHDHALRIQEDLINVARYIVLNPVRAGLVRRVGAYPFWDAIWLDEEHRG